MFRSGRSNDSTLKDTDSRLGQFRPHELKACRGEEHSVFVECAFESSRQHQHVDVVCLCHRRGRVVGHNHLDHEHTAIRWHRMSAVSENLSSSLIVPVMQYELQ